MRNTIIADIISKIFPNQQKLISAQKLQDVLTNLIANVGVLGQDAGLRDHDPSRQYSTGDTCIKGNIIFRALEDVSGSFNASVWQPVAQMPVVATLTERDAISYRFEGMLCYVQSNSTTYRLVGGVANGNWQALGRIELHTYRFKPTAGQQNFSIPDRQIIALRVNGVTYGSASYTLSGGNGSMQTLTWDIDQFILDDGDVLELLYAGSEVVLSGTTAITPGVKVKQIDGLTELFAPSPIASVSVPGLPSGGGRWGVAFGNGVWVVSGRQNADWLISTDNGQSWQITTGPVRDYDFVNFGNGWFIAMAQLAGSNIARSEDGVNWTVSSYGDYWQYADYGNGVWIAVSWNSQRIARSTDNGATWSGVAKPEGNIWRDVAYGDGVWMVAGASGSSTYNLLRSTDDGLSFTGITLGAPVNRVKFGNGIWLASSASKLYRSVDGGATWHEVITGYTGGGDLVFTGTYFIWFAGVKILWSEDGLVWNYHGDVGGINSINHCDYHNGVIVATSVNNKVVVIRLRTPVYAGDPVSALANDAGYITAEDLPELPEVSFLALQDTPSDYMGQAKKVVVVNEDETGVEFLDIPDSHDTWQDYKYNLAHRGLEKVVDAKNLARFGIDSSFVAEVLGSQFGLDTKSRLALNRRGVFIESVGTGTTIEFEFTETGFRFKHGSASAASLYFSTANLTANRLIKFPDVGNAQLIADSLHDSKIYARKNGDWVEISIDNKVDKIPGKGLSSEDYTTAEKNKLAGLESSKFRGQYLSLQALEDAEVGGLGAYAYVDGGVGVDVETYLWDSTDEKWVKLGGTSTSETPASIKTKYESNADTNAFTDGEKSKLSGIEAGAQVNVQSDWNASSGAASIKNKPSVFPAAAHTHGIDDVTGLADALDNKVDKVAGKGLSSNDYTTGEKNKLSGIEAGAQVNVQSDWNAGSGAASIKNKPSVFPAADHTHDMGDVTGLSGALGNKVDKVAGKGLSSNDYTSVEKSKLSGIEVGAQVNVQADWGASSGAASIKNKPSVFPAAAHTHGMGDVTGLTGALGNKVDKVAGKGLSTNDYTSAEKSKLSGIEAGAQVNVQPDWNAGSGAASIKNKPEVITEEMVKVKHRGFEAGQGSVTIPIELDEVAGKLTIPLKEGNMFFSMAEADFDIVLDTTDVEYSQNVSILIYSDGDSRLNMPGMVVLGDENVLNSEEWMLINISFWRHPWMEDKVIAVLNNLGEA